MAAEPGRRSRVATVAAAVRRFAGRRDVRRLSWRLAIVVLALVGAALGLAVAGSVSSSVGPVKARFALHPSASLKGGTTVEIPPLGSMHLATNRAPVELDATVTDIDATKARQLIDDPSRIKDLEKQVTRDVAGALVAVVVRSALAALVGAAVLTFVVTRRWRASAAASVVVLLVGLASGGLAWGTWNSQALAEPHYSGLLSEAPTVVGNVQNIVNRFGKYSTELANLVTNMSKLYGVTSTLPVFSPSSGTIAVLHVSDIHDNPEAWSVIDAISRQFDVDFVIDTGDLSDHGTAAENGIADGIGRLGKPYVFIKGNHDSALTLQAVEAQPNAVVLDDSATTIDGVRIYGAPDPRFTPDQEVTVSEDLVKEDGAALAKQVAAAQPPKIDILLVHDPVEGMASAGEVPLILAGHLHKRDVTQLKGGTTLFVEGSTGGAGLRALDHKTPTPVEASVLYFDPTTHEMVAYDEITVGGLGLTSVSVDRHVVGSTAAQGTPSPSPSSPSSVSPSSVSPSSVSPSSVLPSSVSPSPASSTSPGTERSGSP